MVIYKIKSVKKEVESYMKNYAIGLDIGTTSIGWVCLSDDYQVLQHNNRYAFGVHEFEEAQPASGRRLKRGTRRRYNRRKKRIQLLQQLFEEPVSKINSTFFTKDFSKHFWRNNNQFEERTLSGTLRELSVNTRMYPTMYHLRYDLMQTKEKMDIRLVYLALHHLVKYRGHFLQEGLRWAESGNVAKGEDTETLYELVDSYERFVQDEDSYLLDKIELSEMKNILLDNTKTKNDKVKFLVAKTNKKYEQLFKLLAGLESACSKLFPLSDNIDVYIKDKLKFSIISEKFEEEVAKLTEEENEFIEAAVAVYQQFVLSDLLGDYTCVAEAKVADYQKFAQELKDLKYIVDKYAGEKTYRKLFITSKRAQTVYKQKHNLSVLSLFDQYLNSKKEGEKFQSEVKKLLKDAEKQVEQQDHGLIKKLIVTAEDGTLLRRQRDSQNAAIPYQNNVYEAEKILKNQQIHHPFITDEVIEKVKQIISFRIPYYIGPLDKSGKSEFAWLTRNNEQNITPWTFDESVNKEVTAEAFITKMTNKCTYLKKEDVLPKNSLLYQKFELLNELNSIQIRPLNEESNKKYRLDTECKQWLIENVFQKYQQVTHKILLQELKKSDWADLATHAVFGTQKSDKFASTLSSYKKLSDILPNEPEDIIEEIIKWLTVYNEKDIIHSRIQKVFPHITEEQIQKLCGIKMSGWGRLSRKVLIDIQVNDTDNVIDYMDAYSENFMELLSKTSLKKGIEQVNTKKTIHKIVYKDIEELAGSPALKRGIWRALKIIEELTSIFGEPTEIILEVAREDQKSSKPKSRKDIWEESVKGWIEHQAFCAKISSYPEDKFKDKRFWLYATQLGKCLYTGEAIDINELYSKKYEVDHIYPRSYVKDDSLDNLALVKTEVNQEKRSTKMPLEIISDSEKFKMKNEWQRLRDRKLISSRKLERLLKPKFEDADKEKFIQRQLVETRQIIQHVKDLLTERFEHTNIHSVKAGMVSKFRQTLEIPKIREYNNKHHAMDALLATLLVQFTKQQYGDNFLEFSFKAKERAKKWGRVVQNSRDFFVFEHFKKASFNSILTGKSIPAMLFMKEIFYELPWQTTKMTGNIEGAFHKETPLSPKANLNKEKLSNASVFVVDGMTKEGIWAIEYTMQKKKGTEKKLELFDFKVIDQSKYQNLSLDEVAKILVEREGKKFVLSAKLVKRFPKYQKIMWAGHPYYFISTVELRNAKQWCMKPLLFEQLQSKNLQNQPAEELKQLFSSLAADFLENYTIYNGRIPTKYKGFSNNVYAFMDRIVDFNSFKIGVDALHGLAAANAESPSLFGTSRLYNLSIDATTIEIINESITGLKYRKPKPLLYSRS